MSEKLSSTTVVLIVLFAIIGFFVLTRCKMSCSKKEGLSHRLNTHYVLKDTAYERSYKTPYTQKWRYDLTSSEPESESYTEMPREDFGHHRGCTPSPITCASGFFFNKAVGRCESRLQGVSSATAIKLDRPGPTPYVTLPGSTMLGYGVGCTDPVNVPVDVRF